MAHFEDITMRKTFTYMQDVYGGCGWLLRDMQQWGDGAGNSQPTFMAHDVLEHIGPQTGAIEEEIAAFGAILYSERVKDLTQLADELAATISATGSDVITPKRMLKGATVVKEFAALAAKSQDLDFPVNEAALIACLQKGWNQAQKRYKEPSNLREIYHHIRDVLGHYLTHDVKHPNIGDKLTIEFYPFEPWRVNVYYRPIYR